MAKPANQDTNWDFTVIQTQLRLPGANGIEGMPAKVWANVRTDTNAVVGVVSEKGYGLIQNADFLNTVESGLNSLGLTGFARSVIVSDFGRKLYATYTFNNRVKAMSKVGDKVGLVLRFANSFDSSIAARGELMALVLRCLNGAMTQDGEFSLYQRHTTKINLDFVAKVIGGAVNSFDESIAMFDRLAAVPVSDEQGLNILANIGLSGRVGEAIGQIWTRPSFAESRARTLYALYDAATEYLRDIEQARFEYAQKVNRTILRRLVGGLDAVTLAQLSAKPVIDVESTQIIEG
jgi:hypothetical protein